MLGRERVPKYAVRPDAYGTVDEASAFLGMARAQAKDNRMRDLILAIQHDLYNLMADLATLPETATRPPWLSADRLDWLEEQTHVLGAEVEMPRAFIVPGDSVTGAALEIACTVIRRAERLVAGRPRRRAGYDIPLEVLNRLSSLLLVMAWVEDRVAGVERFTLAAGNDPLNDKKKLRPSLPLSLQDPSHSSFPVFRPNDDETSSRNGRTSTCFSAPICPFPAA